MAKNSSFVMDPVDVLFVMLKCSMFPTETALLISTEKTSSQRFSSRSNITGLIAWMVTT